MNWRTVLVLAAAATAMPGWAGCGSDGGPPRYTLSGMVTYHGQPVPAGCIQFSPDAASGNSGPGTNADIINGRYETMPGRGTIGGPHVVTLDGYDGQASQGGPAGNPMGRRLFADYQVKVDLPKEAATRDFEVLATEGRAK